MTIRFYVVQFVLLSILFSSCKRNISKKDNAFFTQYVAAFTAGEIDVDDEIIVEFATELSPAQQNTIANSAVLRFEPRIKGKADFVNSRTFRFIPEEHLLYGTQYTASVNLKKVFPMIETDEYFRFSFGTKHQSYTYTNEGLKTYNVDDPSLQYISFEFKTNAAAYPDQIKKMVHLEIDGRKPKIKWQHFDSENRHLLRVDSIRRTAEPQQLIMDINGKRIGAESKDRIRYQIPKAGEFFLVNHQMVRKNNPYIRLVFSDPIDPKMDLKGLVYIPDINAQYDVKGNEILYYPSQNLIGDYDLYIDKAIRNVQNHSLQNPQTIKIHFQKYHPEIALKSKGVILPNSSGLFLPIRAVNLSAIRVRVVRIMAKNISFFLQNNSYDGDEQLKRVGRIIYEGIVPLKLKKGQYRGSWSDFTLDLTQFFDAEPGAIYRIYLAMDYNASTYPCKQEEEQAKSVFVDYSENDPFIKNDQNYWDYFGYDINRNRSEAFNWRDRRNPCKPSYYLDRRNVISQNVLASNLGLMAKTDDQGLAVTVTDLIHANPLSGVELSILNFQGGEIAKAKTNDEGMARIEFKGKPYLLVASLGHQRGYLRLAEGDVRSLSMFEVEGVKATDGIKLFQYADRDVWRPGDMIYLQAVIENKQEQLPLGHPIIFELFDPKDKLVYKDIVSYNGNSIYPFHIKTNPNSITGVWRSVIKIGNQSFSKNLSVETIKPNRLKIDIHPDKPFFDASDKKLRFELRAAWLHGAKVAYLRTDVRMKMRPLHTTFDDYENYSFDDRTRSFKDKEHLIFEGKLDEDGKRNIYYPIKIHAQVPGKLSFDLTTKVYEPGGNFSIDRFDIPYAPYDYYVGIKIPKGNGWRNALMHNETNIMQIVSLDPSGNKADERNLKIELFRIDRSWWWDYTDSRSNFINNQYLKKIKTEEVTTRYGKAQYHIPSDIKWGMYLIRVVDTKSGHATSELFRMSYNWDQQNQAGTPDDIKEGAKMLQMEPDKDRYNIGERVRINLPKIKTGRILVSLEKGSTILEQFWADATSKQSKIEFITRPEMAPNVYVHVSLLQPHDQTVNDLPIRLYGVQSIEVNDQSNRLLPDIKTPDTWRPETTQKITVSESNGHAMEYTLAIVDEGLLALTNFQTPDLHKHFYAKEALLVQTWDMYDWVIGAQSGELASLLSVGGDASKPNYGAMKANRFPPMVRFIGPFKLKAGAHNEHTIDVPNYVGAVRVMVVAADQGKYGRVDKNILVKKPLMVQATLPRVLGPGERLSMPISVFALEDKIKDVRITLKTNALINTLNKSQTIHFDKTGDQVVYFDLDIPKQIGIADIQISAVSADERATENIQIEVRAPNPLMSERLFYRLDPGDQLDTVVAAIGIQGTNEARIELTHQLPINLSERLSYLTGYPHGCIEQTTSSVFPQLYLDKIISMDTGRISTIEANIKAGIRRIYSMQLPNGGIGYWPGDRTASAWGTNYAGHFMLEAKNKGYRLPEAYLNSWSKYQTKMANHWLPSSYTYRNADLIQAYRLYTLALANKPAIGAMNRLRNEANLSDQAKWRLALSYALIGQQATALQLINRAQVDLPKYRSHSFTFGSASRDQAMILETLMALDVGTTQESTIQKLIEILSNKLNSKHWYNTQETAYMLLSLAKYIQRTQVAGVYSADLSVGQETIKIDKSDRLFAKKIHLNADDTRININNTGSSTIYFNLIRQGIPLRTKDVKLDDNLEMKIRYLDLNGNTLDPKSLTQGTDFQIEVKVKNPGLLGAYHNLALTQIFPGGWEIHNDRLDNRTTTTGATYDYRDIRDDRVLMYFGLQPNEEKRFVTRLNASYSGEYYMPSIQAEAMYDRDIRAVSPGEMIRVVAAD